MERETRHIAFDLGAESGRCVVGSVGGKRLSLSEVHRFPSHRVQAGGETYWDILAIFEEIKTGLRRAVEAHGRHFQSISVDSWGVDYVLLDGSGRLLGYPYHYRSLRTDGMMDRAFAEVSRERIYEATGIQFMPINTVYQLLAEREQETPLTAIAHRLLLVPDFFLYLLSGRMCAEYTIASTTQLADPRGRGWALDLIDDLRLSRRLFPEIVEPGTALGPLLDEHVGEAGMDSAPIVYAAASHDTAAAVAAVPAVGGRWAYLSSGSWSLMGVETQQPVISAASLAGNFTNEGGVAGTNRLLKNIGGLWLLQACRRHWADHGEHYDYETLAELAASAAPTRAWVDPNDPRFLAPGDMPARILALLAETGQDHCDDVAWISRCILESLALKYRQVFRELERLAGRIERLHVVGGGSRNRLLCQMTADAVGREVVAGPAEATAAGNIGVQLMAADQVSGLAALRRLIADSFELTTYAPEQTSYWEEAAAFFDTLTQRIA